MLYVIKWKGISTILTDIILRPWWLKFFKGYVKKKLLRTLKVLIYCLQFFPRSILNTWLCVVEVTSKFMSFFLYGIPSIFRSLRATKIFRFMNMSQYAATPSIILNYNWSHLFNGIVSPIISPQSSYAECSFEMWVERLHTLYMKCQCSRISIYK